MPKFKMRIVLTLILLYCAFFCQAQINSPSSANSDRLTFDEWMQSHNWHSLEEAIPSLLEWKLRKENEVPFKEQDYNDIVMSLNQCYMQLGDISSSQKLLSSAMEVFTRKGNSPNTEYMRNLWICRGQLEVMLKDYNTALAYLYQAQYMFEEANDFGEDYLRMMLVMASVHQAYGDILTAKLYMDEAMEQFEQLYGSIFSFSNKEHFPFLLCYGNICLEVGHLTEAEKCFKYIVDNCQRTSFSQDYYSLACNNLANVYIMQKKWPKGKKLLESLEGSNDEENYLYAQNLALCYFYSNEISKTIATLQSMNNYSLSNIVKIFTNFTEVEREKYWERTSTERIFFNNLIAVRTQNNQAICTAYDNALFCKTLLVNSRHLLDNYVSTSSNHELKQLYYTYHQLKNKLAYKTNSIARRDSLWFELVDIEREMLNNVGNLGQWLSEKSKTWKDVQESLNNGEIAIEFCYAPQTERFPDPDVQFNYIAFVIRKDYDYPKLVSLENINRVDSVIDDKIADEIFINELYASDKTLALYKMLWEKLAPYLKGIKTVYYSPSGQLSNVNFDVIRDEAGVMLNERYTMCRVSSTTKISSVKASRAVSYQSSVLYGNIKYDESMDAMAEASSAYDEYSGTEIGSELALRSENERGKWGPIPSTKKEIENIYRLLKGKGVSVSVFDSIAANEESFKSLHRRSPDILHLATHGFVIDTPQKAKGNKFVATTNIYSQKDSYLMWAGLMLAGGNNIWQGRFNLTNVEDGILTADEISRLDLSNTKLVVLSACETARGKVDPVDGVYGLQRAFKLAGVQTIVMSLWKVQDDATAMLMTQFYTYLTSGVEKHKALWKAMMDVRKKYKDPYYWAGFIMLD